jgi:hypothetical protein
MNKEKNLLEKILGKKGREKRVEKTSRDVEDSTKLKKVTTRIL